MHSMGLSCQREQDRDAAASLQIRAPSAELLATTDATEPMIRATWPRRIGDSCFAWSWNVVSVERKKMYL
jgi:hypothetical protein